MRLASSQRSVEVHVKGVEVAIVDADEVASGDEGAVEFGGIVDFAEDVELQCERATVKSKQFVLGERGDDQQDGVGAMGAGLEQLELVDDEVLAQARDRGGRRGELPDS